jgi:hypothetical protein
MGEEEKWTGWNDGRGIINAHGCLIMVDSVTLFSYDMKIEKREGRSSDWLARPLAPAGDRGTQ